MSIAINNLVVILNDIRLDQQAIAVSVTADIDWFTGASMFTTVAELAVWLFPVLTSRAQSAADWRL